MPKTLVVHYSLGGTTRRVAEEIARPLGADLDAIEDIRPRGLFGTLRGALESLARGVPAIRHARDPSAYDLVVLGSPVWGLSMSSPMRAYLLRHGERLRDVACFCTWGGIGGWDAALEEMSAMAGAPRAVTAALHERAVRRDQHRASLSTFVERLRRPVAEAA